MGNATGAIAEGHLGEQTLVKHELSSQALTSTTNGTAIDRKSYNVAEAIVNIGAVTGTSPTLDIKVQESDTSGGTYTDAAVGQYGAVTLSQKVAADANKSFALIVDLRKLKQFVRLVFTVGGTSPSFQTAAVLVLSGTDFYPAA